MYSFDEFESDVAAVFAFLEGDYGMQRTQERAAAWVTYASSCARVRVYYELGAGVTTSIEDPNYERKPLDTSRSFNVSEVAQGEKLHEHDTSRANVLEQATFLRIHGNHVLAGDFAALHGKHDRLVAATRRNA